MTFGSLFSGIGGIDLGFERAGLECRWQCEVDPFCNRVLAKHWPNVRRFGDIKEIDCAELERVDVVAGGYPCQPFSLSGKRTGTADDRHLWPEMLRIVRQLRPSWVVGENVTGHISMGLDAVLADLEAEGYACRAFVLPAAGVDASHLRHRTFAVAHADRGGRQGERLAQHSQLEGPRRNEPDRCGESGRWNGPATLANPSSAGLPLSQQEDIQGARGRQEGRAAAERSWWSVEPAVGRVAHGVPGRMDRLRALGNAVVPQVAEVIGRAIVEASR